MSRLTIAPTLAALGLLVGCDGFDIYNSSPFANAEISDALGDDLDYAPTADSDASAALVGIIRIPSVQCGESQCVGGGRGVLPLEGRDAVRAAYFDVMGYPDTRAFDTHTGEGHENATLDGVWASAVEQVREVQAAIVEAGFSQCAGLPEVDRHYELRSGILDVGRGERTVPSRFEDGGKTLERHASVELVASDLVASVDFSCDNNSVYFELEYEEGVAHHTRAWVSPLENGGVDIDLVASIGPVLHGASLAIRPSGVDATLVRVDEEDGREHGTRTVLATEADRSIASAFQHEVVSSSLWEDRVAAKVDLKVEDSAFVICADFLGDDDSTDGACDDFALPAPSDSAFQPGADLTLSWAGAPIGKDGLIDRLVRDE